MAISRAFWRGTLCIGAYLIISVSEASADDREVCQILGKQEAILGEKAKEKLKRYGFAELYTENETWREFFPPVFVSKTIVHECAARWAVGRYLSAFLYDKPKFKLTDAEFKLHKESICLVLSKILRNPYGWLSTGYQNLERFPYELVSDDLMPNWQKYLNARAIEGPIDIRYFTESTFQNPDRFLNDSIERDLRTQTYRISIVELYFLQKNMGIRLDLKKVEEDLNSREMANTNASKPNETAKGAIKLLAKKGKISLSECRKFILEFTGSAL